MGYRYGMPFCLLSAPTWDPQGEALGRHGECRTGSQVCSAAAAAAWNVLGLAGARHAVRPKRGASGALSVQVGALGCGARSYLRKALNGGDESTLQVR